MPKTLIFFLLFLTGIFSSAQNALNFDGIDDYVELDALAPELAGSTNFTIEFWMQAHKDDQSSSIRTSLFCVNSLDANGNRLLIILGGTYEQEGKIMIYDQGSWGVGYDFISSEVVGDSLCHHIAYVRDGTTGYIYIDGVNVGSHVANFVLNATDLYSLGQEWDDTDGLPPYTSSQFYNGNIDELRIWNVSRTEDEINGGMDTELTGSEAGLLAYYNFDQGVAGGDNPLVDELIDVADFDLDGELSNFSLEGDYSNWIYGCIDTDTDSVDCSDPAYQPVADFEFVIGGFSSEDGATGGCFSSPVQFNDLSTIADPGTIVSWDWDFGDGTTSDEENPEHTYGAPGTYTVTLTVETEHGCTATISIDIIMTEGLDLEIISNDPTCFGFSDGSITVNVTGGVGDLVFEIKNDLGDLMNEDNSNTANTLPTGTYTITVSDGTECSGEATVFLDQPDEMNADLTVVDPLCYGDATGWVRVDSVYNATGLYDQISFFWAPNPPNHEGLGADSLWDLYAGDYTLTINDENGCSKVFDFVVDEPDSLHFVEFGFEDAYCRMFGYQSGNGVVFGAAAGGTPDYTYLWENLDNGETEITSTWGGLNPGDYRLTATDENGCIISRELFLDSLNPEAIFTVISDQLNDDCQGTAPVEVEFENNSINFYNENDPFGDSTFFWNLNSPNGDWQLTHDYLYRPDTIYLEKNQTYEVEVCLVALNKNGCSDTACKIITVYKPIAFEDINIFTPNGDGNNDVFTFEFRAASISEFHCVIVNRWGVVIKELNDITEGWDGTNPNGNLCTDGVYFYKYRAVTESNNIISGQGTIQLVSEN